jgi:hypothetical protein
MAEEASQFITRGGKVRDLTRAVIGSWLNSFQSVIRAEAFDRGSFERDFACTMLLAIVDADCVACAQIGDGCIVASSTDDPEYNWIFWPDKGEYENETFFATDRRAEERLQFELINRRFEELAVLTDGLQRLALDFKTNTAHGPFFQALFGPVRTEPDGLSSVLSKSLFTFLTSDRINDRTDDDKTIILATRIPHSPPQYDD